MKIRILSLFITISAMASAQTTLLPTNRSTR